MVMPWLELVYGPGKWQGRMIGLKGSRRIHQRFQMKTRGRRFGWKGSLLPARAIELTLPVEGSTPLTVLRIMNTHLSETTMDNRCQYYPKVANGLAGHGRTFATRLFTFLLDMAHHGDVEFNEIKQVRGVCNSHNVLIHPVRDMGGAVLFTLQACHRAGSTRCPEFRKVRCKNGPNPFVILPEFVKRSTRHNIEHVVDILDRHRVIQYSSCGLKRFWSEPVFLREGINAECWP